MLHGVAMQTTKMLGSVACDRDKDTYSLMQERLFALRIPEEGPTAIIHDTYAQSRSGDPSHRRSRFLWQTPQNHILSPDHACETCMQSLSPSGSIGAAQAWLIMMRLSLLAPPLLPSHNQAPASDRRHTPHTRCDPPN